MTFPLATVIGGNWSASDRYVDAFNEAGRAWDVPPNLLRAIIQRESRGVFDPDVNPTDKYGRKRRNGLPNPILGFSGIYQTTAETWGCDWAAMCASPEEQIFCVARGLRRLYDAYGKGDWGRAVAVYFGGVEALDGLFCDENGLCSDEYVERTYADWIALDKRSEGTGMRIVVVAGHRSHNDPGNAGEKERTPKLARAYRDALRAAGHQVWWLQEHDGDNDPDDTVGGLDTVGARTRDLCAQVGADVMLDLHFEGHPNPNVRGCFAIVPDGAGLATIPGGAPAGDTWANNTLDVELARALVDRLAKGTGLPKRTGIREPGVMSERETFVGTGCGGDCAPSRLAMFAYTANRRDSMVRLVVEHGALTNPMDRAIIDGPGFYEKCGQAAVLAISDWSKDEKPPTTPEPADPRYPQGWTTEKLRGLWGDKYAPAYVFDPKGVVSDVWLKERVMAPLVYHDKEPSGREFFCFSDGTVIGRHGPTEAFRKLEDAKG